MDRQVVILAGGLGTRLRSVVQDVPKPMADIQGKPFLEYLLQLLIQNGYQNFLFLVGYKGDMIKSYFGDGSKFGVNIEYSNEETPLGTGGALFNAWDKLSDDFFLINGDTFFDIQYEILEDFVTSKNHEFLIALRYSDDLSRYGIIEIDDNYKVISFFEKDQVQENRIDGYINSGVYSVKKEILEPYYKTWEEEPISLENRIIPELVEHGKVYGLPIGGKFIDIGVPQDYVKAQKIIPQVLQEERKPAIFVDRDGTIIEDNGYVHGTNLVFKSEIIKLLKRAKEEGKYVIIVTNQAGIAKGMFTEEESILTTEYVIKCMEEYGAHVDGYYYCPYHPEGIVEKYRKISLLRKPEPGMILKACDDFRIDLKSSMMIGDNSEADLIRIPYLETNILENF